MNLGKFLRIAVRTAGFLVSTSVYWVLFELDLLLHRKQRRIDIINKWVPRWSRTSLWLYGVHVKVHGPYADEGKLYPGTGPNGIGRIFVMNHRSSLDIPILFTVAETHVISRHDLATWPLLGHCARSVGTLFVNRESRRSGASVLKEVARVLAAGEAVAMFPEGTAFHDDEVHEFRPGAFNAARRSDAEIIPLGIAYGDEKAYYLRESFLSHVKRLAALRKLNVAVEIGDPLVREEMSTVEIREFARQRVQELVIRARARLSE